VPDRRGDTQAPTAPASHAPTGQRGQALVEAALVIPVLVVLAFGVVLVGRVVHATVAVQATAREAGRALATAASESEGLAAARERGEAVAAGYGLERGRLELALDSGGFARGGVATVRVRYRVPVAGLLLLSSAEVTVSSEHREHIDRYRSREGSGR
jgi:Flp pilus assembly protein TadG